MLVPTAPGFRNSSRTCPGSSRPRASEAADRGKHGYPDSGLLQILIAENALHLKTVRLVCLGLGCVIGASAKFLCHVNSLPLAKNALHLPSSINPRRACSARVTVVCLSVCLRLRVSVPPTHVCSYGRPYKCTRNAVLNFHVNF